MILTGENYGNGNLKKYRLISLPLPVCWLEIKIQDQALC